MKVMKRSCSLTAVLQFLGFYNYDNEVQDVEILRLLDVTEVEKGS